MALVGVRVVDTHTDAAFANLGIWRVVAQFGIVEVEVRGIQAEPVYAELEPELHIIEHLILHGLAVEVQVRLAGEEVMQVVLPAPAVPAPGRTAEHRQPVVRHGAVRLGVGPDVPVGLFVVAAGTAFDEPLMLVGGMVEYLVDQHAHAAFVARLDQPDEVIQRAEQRIDAAVIGHVVAEILHR